MRAETHSGTDGLDGVWRPVTPYPLGIKGFGHFKLIRADGVTKRLTWIDDQSRDLSKPSASLAGQGTTPIRRTGPVQFVDRLLSFWKLQRVEAAPLLGFRLEDADYVNDVLNGLQPLRGQDPLDRIASLYRIRALLAGIFRDLEVENDWLRERHELLDGRTPLSLLMGTATDLELAREYTETFAGL